MKKKNLFIFLGVFVFLLIVIIALYLWQKNDYSEKEIETIVPMERYEPIDRDAATPIEELTPESLRESLNLIEL